MPGFDTLSREAGRSGAGVSAGHTDADAATLLGVFAAGVRSMTHTFNGMQPFSHRSPGPLEAIADGRSYCEVICDGLHVHPAMIRILRKLAGPERVVLVTDAVAWAGLPDGDYPDGANDVQVRGGEVRIAGTATLAGSTLTMADAVRRYAEFTGTGLTELAAVASANPARLLGEDSRIGQIRVGHAADFVVLSRVLSCNGVMVAGRWVRPFGDPPVLCSIRVNTDP